MVKKHYLPLPTCNYIIMLNVILSHVLVPKWRSSQCHYAECRGAILSAFRGFCRFSEKRKERRFGAKTEGLKN